MRTSRLALAAWLLLALGAVGATAAPATAEELPTRTVVSKVVKVDGHLIFRGRVEPEHVNKSVWIQRKTCGTCEWKGYAKTTSDDASRYRQEIAVPRTGKWFYRARVRAYGGYAESFSGVWKVYLK